MLSNLPVTLAEWPRNNREMVRVRLDLYNRQVVVDCRSWWRDPKGELRPGKGGLTLSVRHLPALAAAVSAALAHARSSGHLTDDEA
jgi:hypothetical protein